jgi:hypothetical protein
MCVHADMGHGAFDDTCQVLKMEQPSLDTTKHLVSEIDSHDLLLHVGDLSYADGYEPIVSTGNHNCFLFLIEKGRFLRGPSHLPLELCVSKLGGSECAHVLRVSLSFL